MADQIPTITLLRTGKDLESYEKGYLTIYNGYGGMISKMLTTRERGHGYVSLRVGKYEMEHSVKNSGRKVKCLRPIEAKITSILIHDAYKDDPDELEGCIAPGLMGGDAVWQNSAEAMDEMWKALGGYEPGKRVILNVLTNVSYATGTRDSWSRLD